MDGGSIKRCNINELGCAGECTDKRPLSAFIRARRTGLLDELCHDGGRITISRPGELLPDIRTECRRLRLPDRAAPIRSELHPAFFAVGQRSWKSRNRKTPAGLRVPGFEAPTGHDESS